MKMNIFEDARAHKRLDRVEDFQMALAREIQTVAGTMLQLLADIRAITDRQTNEARLLSNALARSEVERRAEIAFLTGASDPREIFEAGRNSFAASSPAVFSAEQWALPAWMQDTPSAAPEAPASTDEAGQA